MLLIIVNQVFNLLKTQMEMKFISSTIQAAAKNEDEIYLIDY